MPAPYDTTRTFPVVLIFFEPPVYREGGLTIKTSNKRNSTFAIFTVCDVSPVNDTPVTSSFSAETYVILVPAAAAKLLTAWLVEDCPHLAL